MNKRQPQIHKVWTFGDYSVTRKVNPTEQVDVADGFFEDWHQINLLQVCAGSLCSAEIPLIEVSNVWAFLTS